MIHFSVKEVRGGHLLKSDDKEVFIDSYGNIDVTKLAPKFGERVLKGGATINVKDIGNNSINTESIPETIAFIGGLFKEIKNKKNELVAKAIQTKNEAIIKGIEKAEKVIKQLQSEKNSYIAELNNKVNNEITRINNKIDEKIKPLSDIKEIAILQNKKNELIEKVNKNKNELIEKVNKIDEKIASLQNTIKEFTIKINNTIDKEIKNVSNNMDKGLAKGDNIINKGITKVENNFMGAAHATIISSLENQNRNLRQDNNDKLRGALKDANIANKELTNKQKFIQYISFGICLIIVVFVIFLISKSRREVETGKMKELKGEKRFGKRDSISRRKRTSAFT
jgi:DNA repair exonuclease SbcCD ATPase subunit